MHTIPILGCNSLDSARCLVWVEQHAMHILHNWEIRLHRGCDAASLEISFDPVDFFYLNMENRSPPNFHISIYFLVFSQSIKVFVVERKCKQVMTKWNPTVKSQLTETYFCGVNHCRYLFFTEHYNKFSINTQKIWIWQMGFGWVLCSFRWHRKGCSWTRLNLVPFFVEVFMINFCFDDKFVYFA